MKGGYFLVNGKFFKEADPVFTLNELSSRDNGFCLQFRAENNEVLFVEMISAHLLQLAELHGLNLDGVIDAEGRLLRKDVSRLLNKNKLYLAAKITIQLYSLEGNAQCILEASEIDRGYFPLADIGLLLSFYHNEPTQDVISQTFAANGFHLLNSARRKARELNKPNFILLDQLENAIGTIAGSFGYLKEKMAVLASGIDPVFRCPIRQAVAESLEQANFKVQTADTISGEELLLADELFLFDAVNGIQKVLGLEDRRYYSVKTPLIAEKLTELAKKDRAAKG